jgi:hypothetical protein
MFLKGVMMIDRDDELAALHEKAHLQEAQIAAGTMELGVRENEVRGMGYWGAAWPGPRPCAWTTLTGSTACPKPARGLDWLCLCLE